MTETCDPENKLQLITKVQVAPNNTNDNDLLVEALPDLKDRTGLERLYTDGPYAGPKVDEVLQTCQVEQIQTGINGKVPDPDKLHLADFEIQQNADAIPTQITCPQGQTVSVHLSSRQKSYRADFDPQVCQSCPYHLQERCPARPGKKRPTHRLTFLPSQIAVAQRRRRSQTHKQEGKNHRAAIEGTVHQVKHPFPAGKLPVRGLFRVTCMMVGSAAMANVRRIQHYLVEKQKDENRKAGAEQEAKEAQDWHESPFSMFLAMLMSSLKRIFALSDLCFGC